MDQNFQLYAMEQEGYLNTREGKINRAIKMLIACKDPNFEQDYIFEICGIDSLTANEVKRIAETVCKGRV